MGVDPKVLVPTPTQDLSVAPWRVYLGGKETQVVYRVACSKTAILAW